MAKKQWVGPQPVLLKRRVGNQMFARLFYPSKELLIENIWAESAEQIRAEIRSRGWAESAEKIISEVDRLTDACRTRELSTSEIELCQVARLRDIQALAQLWNRGDVAPMRRLKDSIQAMAAACQERGCDQSAQGKFREARLNARFGLGRNHHSVLDGLKELTGIAKRVSSRESADYVMIECSLPADQFLDALHMMATDRSDPAEVVNPPARVRAALQREQSREQYLDRRRSAPLTELLVERLKEPERFEDRVIGEMDWETVVAALDLSEDQRRVLEAGGTG